MTESESLRDGEIKPQAPLFVTFRHKFFAQLSSCKMLWHLVPTSEERDPLEFLGAQL